MLLGNPDEINRVAASQGVELGAGIEIVDPEVVRESYVARLCLLYTSPSPRDELADLVCRLLPGNCLLYTSDAADDLQPV